MTSELRRFERLCLDQAALCTIDEAREALEQLALNYRAAAEIEEQAACPATTGRLLMRRIFGGCGMRAGRD